MARNNTNRTSGSRKREATAREKVAKKETKARVKRPARQRGERRGGERRGGERRGREKVCFVMMPFTDPDGYEADHFQRVYRYIIQPACEMAGYRPVRVDDINTSNHIVIEIIRYIVEADMAICDLSSRSPNVLYELGIRHAFNKPVTLIKDLRTGRMFDIQGLRDIEYDESLRADATEKVIQIIADSLRNNQNVHSRKQSSANSVINLLGIMPAKLPEKFSLSGESELIMSALDELRDRMARLEILAATGMPGAQANQGAQGDGVRATESDRRLDDEAGAASGDDGR